MQSIWVLEQPALLAQEGRRGGRGACTGQALEPGSAPGAAAGPMPVVGAGKEVPKLPLGGGGVGAALTRSLLAATGGVAGLPPGGGGAGSAGGGAGRSGAARRPSREAPGGRRGRAGRGGRLRCPGDAAGGGERGVREGGQDGARPAGRGARRRRTDLAQGRHEEPPPFLPVLLAEELVGGRLRRLHSLPRPSAPRGRLGEGRRRRRSPPPRPCPPARPAAVTSGSSRPPAPPPQSRSRRHSAFPSPGRGRRRPTRTAQAWRRRRRPAPIPSGGRADPAAPPGGRGGQRQGGEPRRLPRELQEAAGGGAGEAVLRSSAGRHPAPTAARLQWSRFQEAERAARPPALVRAGSASGRLAGRTVALQRCHACGDRLHAPGAFAAVQGRRRRSARVSSATAESAFAPSPASSSPQPRVPLVSGGFQCSEQDPGAEGTGARFKGRCSGWLPAPFARAMHGGPVTAPHATGVPPTTKRESRAPTWESPACCRQDFVA